MKKTRRMSAFVFLALFLFCGAASADDPAIKFTRGLVNLITSPLEYYNQYVILDSKYKDPFMPLFGSLLYGTAGTLERILVGAYDLVTFPIPVPAEYKPLITPETPIQALQEMTQ